MIWFGFLLLSSVSNKLTPLINSVVTASSTLGINGEVNIQAPVTHLSGALMPLPQAFARATALLSSRCAERLRAGNVSSFIMRERGRRAGPPRWGLAAAARPRASGGD
jgi:hypothetical protein